MTGWLPVGIFTRPLKQSGVTAVGQKQRPLLHRQGLMVVLSGNSKSVPSLGAGFRPRDGLGSGYRASVNLITKVLDFVQLGGSKWTVGGTVFEMWLGL